MNRREFINCVSSIVALSAIIPYNKKDKNCISVNGNVGLGTSTPNRHLSIYNQNRLS